MTAKQILNAFSESLMQDPRILSSGEQELLANLLQNSKTISSINPEVQSAVSATIARSVGETVAHRAFSLLGGSIVEQILARSGVSSRPESAIRDHPSDVMSTPPSPQPPGGPKPSPQPPGSPNTSPQPPGTSRVEYAVSTLSQQAFPHVRAGSSVGVLEQPEFFRQGIVLEEFLAPQELDELVAFTSEHESDFAESEVISPAGDGMHDYAHRRSRVLMNLGKHEEVILDRIRGVLPSVLDELGIDLFPISRVEAQITASNDGDFFAAHSDDGQEVISSRRLTFVYFFHREPRQFEGGELVLHGASSTNSGSAGTASRQSISPRQNQIVFFPCSCLHEITPVVCRSQAFADSRFTLNGWLHN